MTETHTNERAGFAEKVARLAGRTAYREPIGGFGSRSDYMPDEHAIAAAMAFARRGPNDIGPDVAVAIATGTHAHRMKIVRELAAALLATTGRIGERCADSLLHVSADCYLDVVGAVPAGHGEGITESDYAKLRKLGVMLLWDCAENAFRRARQAYRKAA